LAFSGAAALTAGTHSVLASTGQGSVVPASPENQKSNLDPPFKISLAEWSLPRSINSGKLTNMDFPRIAREEFGIEAIEYVNQFFKDKANDLRYLTDLKMQCEEHDVKSLLIMVDGEGQLGAPDEKARTKSVENHHTWVIAARFLGCHSIRVNAASAGSFEEQAKLAADGLRRLSEFAKTYGLNVIVENHGGLSSNGAWLAQVISSVGMDNCGTLPDFGNFRVSKDEMYDRYKGVTELMPFAKAVSAKSHQFDELGNETNTDYMKMMKIVLDAGYHGYVGIEWEGGGIDEFAGIKATKSILEKCQTALAGK
jgi:sugar phosphate isomerase/epimerase